MYPVSIATGVPGRVSENLYSLCSSLLPAQRQHVREAVQLLRNLLFLLLCCWLHCSALHDMPACPLISFPFGSLRTAHGKAIASAATPDKTYARLCQVCNQGAQHRCCRIFAVGLSPWCAEKNLLIKELSKSSPCDRNLLVAATALKPVK